MTTMLRIGSLMLVGGVFSLINNLCTINLQVSRTDESESEEEIVRKTFTLKQLIRKLHVTEPVEHVMCLIGKK